MFKQRWFSGGLLKPKNPHSLEHLKYLYSVLSKNQQVSDGNRELLVETLRSIAEILIWGDQNDSSVFDFFLEKNMLSFFLKIMRQKCGRYVCIQLLQTLNILFENIRNETSLYYLLSNNHVNSIIVHKFDFSDEEVMAYYISFLKTLSLKLNIHTIHFFYNEHTNDFPLYTEAIKFFNHNESMVRIAVRTLTLNIYKVDDKSMLKFIRDRTAAPYFSNLVWFIGSHIIELDTCASSDVDRQGYHRLSNLVAEHLDHMHYINDMLRLEIESINEVLTEHLLHRLFIPLCVYSLPLNKAQETTSKEVFLILSHRPLVQHLAHIILDKLPSTSEKSSRCSSYDSQHGDLMSKACFIAPPEPLEKLLKSNSLSSNVPDGDSLSVKSNQMQVSVNPVNVTDEEKYEVAQRQSGESIASNSPLDPQKFDLEHRPYLQYIFNVLDCTDNDHEALFALCLLYAININDGKYLSTAKHWYNIQLVEKLIRIIHLSSQHNSKVRLATLELSLLLLKQLVYKNGISFLEDKHLADIEDAREASTLMLRNFYKSEEIFLDMFEDEYKEMKRKSLNVEHLTQDSSLLLQPTGTPLSGVEFYKRLPCGEVERARRAIRVFFLLRDLSLTLRMEPESQLPLTNPQAYIQVGDVLDLNNSDLIACTVISKDGSRIRRFLVIDVIQLILVEPDFKKLGWGVAKCVGFLQDLEVSGDKDDSRSLHVTVHKPCGSNPAACASSSSSRAIPVLTAKFVFDDHIRCMAAKQRLTKGRLKARQRKMHQIARLLELPGNIQPCPSPPAHVILPLRQMDPHARLQRASGHSDTFTSRSKSSSSLSSHHRPIFNSGAMPKVPGVATMMKKEKESQTKIPSVESSSSGGASPRSRRTSGKSSGNSGNQGSIGEISEEIPLEDMTGSSSQSSHTKRHKENGKTRKCKVKSDDRDKEPQRKERLSSEACEYLQPKTLRKAEAPPVSLLTSNSDSESCSASTPKLVPPANSDLVPHGGASSVEHPVTPSNVESETSFSEINHSSSSQPPSTLPITDLKSSFHISPVPSPVDVTMMSISVESQSFDPSSDATMATASSITSSTVSSEILDETLDESIMSESIEKYKSKSNGIKTI
ncbi:Protein CLEC16A [Nymphon striatum]|nr:Protein CLEC16A [Nymphon striatum]